jgi:transposase
MAKVLVDDALWELIEPHLPRSKPRRTGRPRVPDRAALTGIVFVLQTGIPWEYLPREMGCGSRSPAGADGATGSRPERGGESTGRC